MYTDAELVPHTHIYVSNCKFCGIVDTSWYAFDKEQNENIFIILRGDSLREGMNGIIDGLNLQKSSDIILITRKGRKLAKIINSNKKGV